MADAVVQAPAVPAPASGTRSGLVLAVASGAAIAANYVFLLAAGRILGSDGYGSLGALLGLLAVVLVPAVAVQMAVAREVSRLIAAGERDASDAFARAALRLALLATVPLVAVALLLAVPLAHVLNIDSVGIVALTELTFTTSLVFPVAVGVVQGRQRFHALAALLVLPFVFRLALLGILAAAGYRLGGAVVATVGASVGGAALALALIAEPLRQGATLPRPSLRRFLRYLAPVGVGLIGIALLTHVDILVVKARFTDDDAGAYAAASAFARVAFFFPATILAVLFPRTAARQVRGEHTDDILGRSLLATLGFCTLLVLFYAAAGRGLITATFGTDFAEGGSVLAPLAIAIAFYSVAQILVGYHLSRGESRYAWIVAASVPLQLAVLGLVPATLRWIVWANAVVAAGLIVAHELFAGSSVPALRAGARRFQRAVAGVHLFAGEAALVLGGVTAFVCALFWPTLVHPGSTIIGTPGSDSTGTIAGLWQQLHESGYHILGTSHHTFSGAPFGWEESNALNMQVLLAYYPAYLLAHVIGVVAAYNVVTLAGYILSGATMYLLVRYLGGARLVAAWAALVFIIFPFHLVHEEHASLIHLEVLALLLLALAAAARRPSWPRLLLVGVANLACWLMSGYFGPMAAITTIAFALGAGLTLNRRFGLVLALGATAGAILAAAVVGVAAVASGTNGAVGLHRDLTDLDVFGVRAYDLLVPPPQNLTFGDHLASFWATHSHGSNATELANYVGWLTIALAVAWLVAWRLRRRTTSGTISAVTAGLVASFVVGVAFAAPSPTSILGHDVDMPARLLWEIVPAFRVLSRWDFLLMAVLVPLAALGLQLVWNALARRRVALAAGTVLLTMTISFVELATDPAKNHFRTVPTPPEYRALSQTPRGILAEYPLGYSDIYRLWQWKHGRPLFNGAPEGTTADHARLVLVDPKQRGTAAALSFLGVTAIEIHPGGPADVPVQPQEPEAQGDGYRLVGRYAGDVTVWKVVARPAPALVTLPGGFAAPRLLDDGVVGYAFVAPSGVGAVEIVAKTAGVVRVVFDATPPSGARRVLRLAAGDQQVSVTLQGETPVAVLVAVPRGRSQLLVKTDPAATSEADAIVLSTPRAEAASGEPALHAQQISADPGF